MELGGWRLVDTSGNTAVTYKNISKKRRRYFSDLYTTLLDTSWWVGWLSLAIARS